MKTFSLEEVTNELISKVGTLNRDRFEAELQNELKQKKVKQPEKLFQVVLLISY